MSFFNAREYIGMSMGESFSNLCDIVQHYGAIDFIVRLDTVTSPTMDFIDNFMKDDQKNGQFYRECLQEWWFRGYDKAKVQYRELMSRIERGEKPEILKYVYGDKLVERVERDFKVKQETEKMWSKGFSSVKFDKADLELFK